MNIETYKKNGRTFMKSIPQIAEKTVEQTAKQVVDELNLFGDLGL